MMKLFGLTGGVGMGKSTAADLLQQRGIAIVDTDVIAREVVEPGQPALEGVKRTFGANMIGADGRLRRDELAALVFSDTTARQKLEAILHPRIRAAWFAQVDAWRAENRSVGVVVIPLLFETNSQSLFDAVVCVACSPATQRARLAARGWSVDEIDKRIQAQWPTEKKMAASDYVIWTEGSLAAHADQIDRIFGSP